MQHSQKGPPLSSYPGSFTQWVPDNDATLDGLGTFHGMGIIAVSTCTSKATDIIAETTVP